MLKVNRKAGKVDIVLNEESLLKVDRNNGFKGGKASNKETSTKTLEGKLQSKPLRTASVATNKQSKAKHGKISSGTTQKHGSDGGNAKKGVLGGECEAYEMGKKADVSYKRSKEVHHNLQQLQELKELSLEDQNFDQPLTRVIRESHEAHKYEVKPSKKSDDPTTNEETRMLEKNLHWKKELGDQVAQKQKLRAQEKDRSKGETFEEYNPWGRPGGGAPARTQSGNVVADYRRTTLDLSSKSETNTLSAGAAMSHTVSTTVNEQGSQQDATTATGAATIPTAMRSSFAIGAPGVVHYETQERKTEQRKIWLKDLEQQIIEKKERENQQKYQRLQQEPRHGKQISIVKEFQSLSKSPEDTLEHSDFSEPSLLGSSFREGNSHARGHGLHSLHQMNQEEQEKRRLKTLEHQLAIQEQVEEKRRMKQVEKERKLRDEAEQERKLVEERAILQNKLKEEHEARQEKEEEARRRAEALHLNVLQAYELAQQTKLEKRIKQLEDGGHDVSGLKSRAKAGSSLLDYSTNTSPRRRQEPDSSTTQNSQTSLEVQETSRSAMSDGKISAMNDDKNSSFRLELEESILNTSLESEWRDSSTVVPEKKLIPAVSSSPRKSMESVKRTTRSHSEKGERKRQVVKQNKKRPSLQNMSTPSSNSRTGLDSDDKSPLPLPMEDAFLVPYRRTSSATFHAVPDIPLQTKFTEAQKATFTKRTATKALGGESTPATVPMFRTASTHLHEETNGNASIRLAKNSMRHTVVLRKDKVKPVRTTQKEMNRQRVVKKDSSPAGSGVGKKDRNEVIRAGTDPLTQISPDLLPTSRQELILQQLAALRQGLMLKERELQRGAF